MRARSLVLLVVAILATPVLAKDVYLSIAGSVGAFRTDARIFNPSSEKDIQVQAYFLPVGNVDNSGVQAKTITVPKRSMAVYDDIVTTLFAATGLGAVKLTSPDNFIATQRIYAQTASGTLGQFVPGLEPSAAKTNGVLIQMKSGGGFRTNVGAVNPNAVTANVTWRLRDKNNALVATGTPIAMPPGAVIGPTNVASTFFFTPGSADLSDMWVSYTSDQPIFAYASVVDNATTDPTFVPMSEDSGTDPVVAPPPQGKTFTVSLKSFEIDVDPPLDGLKVGDTVTFRVHAVDEGHGFILSDPNGATVIADRSPTRGFREGTIFEQTFTVSAAGTYNYFCTHPTCGSGHNAMTGSFTTNP